MNSRDYKNKLIESLNNIMYNVDDIYCHMELELRKEIINKKENIEKINQETKDIYNILTNKLCIKLIRKILPLRIKLLNKIHWGGKSITGNGKITIWFYFNETNVNFNYEFYSEDIKQLLNL